MLNKPEMHRLLEAAIHPDVSAIPPIMREVAIGNGLHSPKPLSFLEKLRPGQPSRECLVSMQVFNQQGWQAVACDAKTELSRYKGLMRLHPPNYYHNPKDKRNLREKLLDEYDAWRRRERTRSVQEDMSRIRHKLSDLKKKNNQAH